MEKLVNRLAELQAESSRIVDAIARDRRIDEYAAAIVELKNQVAEGTAALKELVDVYGQDDLQKRIDETKTQLIDEWDESKKTYKYGDKTLSFRQTGSLNIIDDVRMMELLIEKAPVADIVSKYSKGFKLTGVKKFVEVHNVQTGVASMEYKTTVSLKTE